MADFIFRLGPLDAEGGSFFQYYVYPGREGADVFPAMDDDQAFDNILDEYSASEVVCEPSLAEAGARWNVASEPLSVLASHGLALMGLDRLPDRPFQSIDREGLIYRLAASLASFVENHGDLRHFAGQHFELSVVGPFEFATVVYLHDIEAGGRFMTVLLDRPDEPWASLTTKVDRLREYNHLSVDIARSPAFVLDAVNRAHGLEVIPVPWAFVDGERVPVHDGYLAILAVCTGALAALEDDWSAASSRIELGDLDIACDVTRMDTGDSESH